MKNIFKEKNVIETMSICLLPVMLYGIAGPLEIFVGNSLEFDFLLKDFFFYFLGISLIIWIFLTIALMALPSKISAVFKLIIFTFSFLSYIQNMFLNKKLINEDGSPMNWENMRQLMGINLFVWIVIALIIFTVAFFLKEKSIKICYSGSCFLIAVQFVAIISMLLQTRWGGYSSQDPLRLNSESQFIAASKNNIIIFVLDTYSNSIFEQAMDENPEFVNAIKDFTYYDNADCHYVGTFPSLIHIITGTEYDCSISKSEWMLGCWDSDKCVNFYDKMHSLGYECDLYFTEAPAYLGGNIDHLENKIDNLIERKRIIQTGLLLRLLEKMSIYKYVPYICKPRFEVYSYVIDQIVYWELEDKINENGLFYEKLLTKGITVDERISNKLSFNYLRGIHTPYYTLPDGRMSETETSLEDTTAGLCVILTEYINQLKENGVYEDATILITADHANANNNSDPQPVFLIKLPNSVHSELEISSAPISLDDIQATILSILEQDYSAFGTSIFDWKDDDRRERECWYPGGGGFLVYTYETNRYELMNQKEEEADIVTYSDY